MKTTRIRWPRMATSCVALVLAGCPSDQGPDSDPDWAKLAELEQGVALAAWSSGDDLIVAGGRLSSAPGQEVGGPGALLRMREGRICREYQSDSTLWWVHGDTPERYFAVGEQGTILAFEGGEMTDESLPREVIFYGIWVESDHAVAVGGDPFETKLGEVWKRTADGAWGPIDLAVPGVAFKIWEDWIVGDGIAYRLEDDALVAYPIPGQPRILTVRGRADDDVWAVGGFSSPEMWHFDGETWNEIEVDPKCAPTGLNGVYTAPGEPVSIAGNSGGVGVFDGQEFDCPKRLITLEHFHAVWPHEGAMWWFGGNLLTGGGETTLFARRGDEAIELEVVDCDDL